MKLEGLHHITAITGDGPRNMDFYARLLGLRLVKKTVNQDDPMVYHLFYADDAGSPGADLTFFVYRGAKQGRAGDGMVHRITWRVASRDALDFWGQRLEAEGVATRRSGDSLHFADPEGLDLELVVSTADDPPLVASAPDIPVDHALQGFAGVRAYNSSPERSSGLLAGLLGFEEVSGSAGAQNGGVTWRAQGDSRHGFYHYDPPPPVPGVGAAGTVHHVAFATQTDDIATWQALLVEAGVRATPIIDRFYFQSVYFREPGGVLFELATMGPGFAVDEHADELGEGLALPPLFEPMRAQLEQALDPLPTVAELRANAAEAAATSPGGA